MIDPVTLITAGGAALGELAHKYPDVTVHAIKLVEALARNDGTTARDARLALAEALALANKHATREAFQAAQAAAKRGA